MPRKSLPIFSRKWLQMLLGGLLLFMGTEFALVFTANPNFYPTLLLVGAFTVPVVFVALIYEHEIAKDISIGCLGICFLIGGAIGVIAAGLLEYTTLQGLSIVSLIGVGLIEETTKLIMPSYQFFRQRNLTEADGLLFGVASGMGFAALETMGYGLTTLITSGGDLAALNQVLFFRGLLSPAGHAAWTGLIVSVMWRERERKGSGFINRSVILAFLVAVFLHFAWDFVNSVNMPSIFGIIIPLAGMLAVAVASITLLIRRMREANRFRAAAVTELAPVDPNQENREEQEINTRV